MSPEPFRGTFVGRATDIEAVKTLLAGGARLVTLLGPGGVGKTRLARRLQGEPEVPFARSHFCDLSSARSTADVVDHVARTVAGIALASGKTLDDASRRIGRALAKKGRLLLVLDNLEQLDGAAFPLVSAWLAAAPRLVVLATSRVRLGLAGEVVHRVEPLATAEALALFEDRARAVGRTGLASGTTPTAASIVTLLEGLPLALEMAAARLVVLTPEELLERLSRPLSVLGAAGRRDPDRHASLSRVLDQSWELLSPIEQRGLTELGVFVGGFTLEAAEGVLSTGSDTMAVVQRLVDSSLLRAEASPQSRRMRFLPWAAVREYAVERLEADGLAEATRLAHARWFGAWGARPRIPLAELVADEPNLAAAGAFLRTIAPRERELRLRVLCALEAVRMGGGQLDLWADDLRSALDAMSEADDVGLVARGRLAIARALHELGRSEAARAAYEDAVAAARRSGDETLVSFSLSGLGRLLANLGSWEEACALFAEARAQHGCSDVARRYAHCCHEFYGSEVGLAKDVLSAVADYVEICRTEDDVRELVFWLAQLGRVASELARDTERAERCMTEAVAIARSVGDLRGEGLASLGLGTHWMAFHELDEARSTLTEAARTLHEAGTVRYAAWALGFLGITHALAGSWTEARAALDEGIRLAASVGDAPREAHLRAFRGVVLARLEDESAAATDFARAPQLAMSRCHAWTLELCSAQLHVLSAHRSADADERRAHVARAKDVLARAGWPEEGRAAVEGPRAWPWGEEFFEPRLAAELLDEAIHDLEEPRGRLVIDRQGAFFVLPSGDRVLVPGRGALQRIVAAFAHAREERPGEPIQPAALVAAGWRGERLRASAASNRLHVALDQLRRLGLRELLVRGDGGWFVDPEVPFRWAGGGN